MHVVQPLEFGDRAGHCFHGNQHTGPRDCGDEEDAKPSSSPRDQILDQKSMDPLVIDVIENRIKEWTERYPKIGAMTTITVGRTEETRAGHALAVTQMPGHDNLRIDLDPKMAADYLAFGGKTARMGDNGFLAVGTIQGVMDHEFAHAVASYVVASDIYPEVPHAWLDDGYFGWASPALAFEAQKAGVMGEDAVHAPDVDIDAWMQNSPSAYAAADPAEYISESYARTQAGGANITDYKIRDWLDSAAERAQKVGVAASLDGEWLPWWEREFGDVAGHPFHGNQWTGGAGAEKNRDALHDALLEGTQQRANPGIADSHDRAMAKQQLVAGRTEDMMRLLADRPGMAAQLDALHQKLGGLYPGDRGLVGERVQAYVDNWTRTAADSNDYALALQHATSEELGINAPDFTKYVEGSGIARAADQVFANEGEIMKAYVRAEYDATQAFLEKAGIGPGEPVQLYRGMSFRETSDIPSSFPRVYGPDYQWGMKTAPDLPLAMNPASSWTTKQDVASGFASQGGFSYLITANVPREDIISTSRTGRGALIEEEVLVRNQPGFTGDVMYRGAWGRGGTQ